MEFDNFIKIILRKKKLISDRFMRFLIYTGLLSLIAFFFVILSNNHMETIENELKREIKQLETGIITEKKLFLKKAVDQAIKIVNSEKKIPLTKENSISNKDSFKKRLRENLTSFNLASNCYVWINRIENYKGGDYYAVREIAPGMERSEGSWLSTGIEDIRGNTPYKTELDGLKKEGEIFYEYHLKKVDSEDIDRRLIYAKLYKPYNWVVATGVYLDRLDHILSKEKNKINSSISEMKKRSLVLISVFISLFSLLLFFLERKVNRLISSCRMEISENRKKLSEICIKDTLTGLNTRKKLNEFLNYEIAKARRYNKIFSIILLDFDHFSKINDSFGRSKGDAILKIAASAMKQSIRSVDIIGRWEGEEFLIICPETDLKGAVNLAEKIRETILTSNYPISETVTASFGTSTFYDRDNIQTLLNRADRALYKAKESGRNRVE